MSGMPPEWYAEQRFWDAVADFLVAAVFGLVLLGLHCGGCLP